MGSSELKTEMKKNTKSLSPLKVVSLKASPGSYKVLYETLFKRLQLVSNLPITDLSYETLNNAFELALVTLHNMPRIWLMYLNTLMDQNLITRTRRIFDRALSSLPVTQHDRIWELYLRFAGRKGVPFETSLRIYRRYLKYDPTYIEDFIDFLVVNERWREGAVMLAALLNDDGFSSTKGKSKHCLWLELCDLVTKHATYMDGLDVDGIIRGGIAQFTHEVGLLWSSLAEYYIRRSLPEKARDVFEEVLTTVWTVRDFGLIFDSYCQFEGSMLDVKMEKMEFIEDVDLEGDEDEDVRWDLELSLPNFEKKILKDFWLYDNDDFDVRLARLERLLDRRPELSNSVLLRQNPHNVERWHHRVNLFQDDPVRQILTFAEAVRTVDPMKAVGKPHTLWLQFAMLYELHNDVDNARVIFDKAMQVNYKSVDDLASLWCEWAKMELRHKNFQGALDLMKRATAEPSVDIKLRVAVDGHGDEPVQMKVHKSLKLWTLYVDLEESFGNLESTRGVYERILDLRIATPQIVINYAMFLENQKCFEDAFRVYERGVKIFKYPHVKDIWVTYLSKFVKRYERSKLERARELFDDAVETAPAECVKPLFLQYAKLEERYGLAKREMKVYERATKAIPANQKLSMYEIYIARAAKLFGVPQTREIYEQAISSGLSDKDMKSICLKFGELEMSLGEIDRARDVYTYASQFADPRTDSDFWNKWNEFEVQHGNEETFREMLRIRRNVAASLSQTHMIIPDHLKNEKKPSTLEKDVPVKEKARVIGFVRKENESESDAERRHINQEEIELPEEEEEVDIAHKDGPNAIFSGLAKKREGEDTRVTETHLGALQRIKRRKFLQ